MITALIANNSSTMHISFDKWLTIEKKRYFKLLIYMCIFLQYNNSTDTGPLEMSQHKRKGDTSKIEWVIVYL
jgi:hypothetical protein